MLSTTVVPTSQSRVGFFFRTSQGTRIGYGQIELDPGPGDPNGVVVYLPREDDGAYELLPRHSRRLPPSRTLGSR